MEFKKIFIVLLLSTIGIKVFAEMRYNPVNNLIYTFPEKPGINQNEYRQLLLHCVELEARLISMNDNKQPSRRTVINQCSAYLKSVGTATARRLIDDLKRNKICYANGKFMKKIFQQ